MNKWYKYVAPGVLALAVTGILQGCSGSGVSHADSAAVSVQVIKLGPSADAGLSGKIIPDQSVNIVSKISGKVAAVNVQEGDKVKKGDVLVQLETNDLQQQVKQAEAGVVASQAQLADAQAGVRAQELQGLQSALRAAQGGYEQATAAVEQAKAAFDLATSTYNRLRNNYSSSSSVTQEDLNRGTLDYEKARTAYEQAKAAQKAAAAQVDAAKSKLDLAVAGPTANALHALQASVDSAQAAFQLASNNLQNATIVAPMDGIVVKKSISPGEMAQPSAPLITLVNMDQVQVELSVAENQIAQVKAGAPVEVKVQDLPDQSFDGTIFFVSPVSNPNSNTFPVKVKVDNKAGLLFAGMMAEVHMRGTPQSRLEVPKSAIVTKDNKTYLFTVENNTAHLVEVHAEEKNQSWVYVQPGDQLKANQTIIVNPTDQLADGAKVQAE